MEGRPRAKKVEPLAQHIVEGHAERVAEGIKSDRLRMTHAQTLQKLYLSRTNEMHLERQLDSERKACEALRAEAKELRKEVAKQTKRGDRLRMRNAALRADLRACNRERVRPPKVCGQALKCSECGQPVDFVPYTMRPRYQYCRWCGAKLRRQ